MGFRVQVQWHDEAYNLITYMIAFVQSFVPAGICLKQSSFICKMYLVQINANSYESHKNFGLIKINLL